MADYKLQRRAAACMVCDAPFADGATIVSAIYEEESASGSFVRRDECERCFESAQGAYSHWRSRQPPAPEEKGRLDYDLALDFLNRLLRDADPQREGLVYALTLLLSRKRRVKLRGVRKLPEGERLSVLVPGEEEDRMVQVRAPALDPETVGAIQDQLARLFGFASKSAEPTPKSL